LFEAWYELVAQGLGGDVEWWGAAPQMQGVFGGQHHLLPMPPSHSRASVAT
jgi:hypothetical protein